MQPVEEKRSYTCYRSGRTDHLASLHVQIPAGQVLLVWESAWVIYERCAGVRREKQQSKRPVRVAQVEEEHAVSPLYALQVCSLVPPLCLTMELNNHSVSMEVDTGAMHTP